MRYFLEKFVYAGRGLYLALRSELNMRLYLIIVAILVSLGYYQQLVAWKWVALFLSIGLVMACEMMNTAIEMTINLYCQDYHPLAKNVKDVAAGAVLLAAIMAALVGVIIFFY